MHLQNIYRSLRSVLLIFLVFCVLLLCDLTFGVRVVISDTNDGWFVLYLQFFAKGSCLINVICVCLRIAVSNAHRVDFFVFLFDFYSFSCVTCVACVYGLSIFCYHFSILYRLLTLAH